MIAATVRALTEMDRPAALALWQARFFDSAPFCAWYFSERFDPALSAGAFSGEGRLLSMALGRRVRLEAGTERADAVLVAGVSTREGFERQGLMRRTMAQVGVLAARAGASLLVLRPVDPAIYLPLGFQPYSAARLAPGTGRAVRAPLPAGRTDPAALADCYAAATGRLSVRQRRTAADMAARLREVESDGGGCVALTDGACVRAYALLESPGGDAVEAAARTAADYAALLDALEKDCLALLPPYAPTGAVVPHAMARALAPAAAFDRGAAVARFLPEEY